MQARTLRRLLAGTALGAGLTLTAASPALAQEQATPPVAGFIEERWTTIDDSINARVNNVGEDDEALAQNGFYEDDS